MVKPKRSRKMNRIYVKTPSNKSKIVYRKPKPKANKCAVCKKPLHGISRLRPSKLRNTSKSKKKPKRIFGGYLCANCAKREIIRRNRK